MSAQRNLCLLFIPTNEEMHNPAYLASRLIAARLAYPSDARSIFLTASAWFMHEFAKSNFDGAFSLEDSEGPKFRDFLFAPEARRARQVRQQVRTETLRRLRASLLAYRWQRVAPPAEVDVRHQELAFGIRQRYIQFSRYRIEQHHRYLHDDVPIIISEARSDLSAPTRAATEAQFLADYSLDNGVPYLERDLKFAVLIASAFAKTEPRDKDLHAAAFAGVVITGTHNIDLLDKLIRRVPRLGKPLELDDM
jgi:hypothetical protein